MFNDNRNFNGQAPVANGFQSRPVQQPMQRPFSQPAVNTQSPYAAAPVADPVPAETTPVQAEPAKPAPKASKPSNGSSGIKGLGDLSFLDDEDGDGIPDLTTETTIKVFGVGGGGSNAVSCMFEKASTEAELVVLNTDYKHLKTTPCDNKILLGLNVTRGKGAGAEPEQGKKAAEEPQTIDLITNELHKESNPENAPIDMLFLTAGMGGGTGTGASPVIAQLAKEMGILTVAVVTKPFEFEGAARMSIAEDGISKLRDYVDAIIVVPNEKLCSLDSGNLSIQQAFDAGNQILMDAVSSICNIITNTSYINLDFADVRKILANSGDAHIGIGIASPDAIQVNNGVNMNGAPTTANYALLAAQNAVDSPLLETTIKGADGLIISYSASEELPLKMLREANDFIRQQAAPNATIIFGFNPDANMGNKVAITVIATRKGGLVDDDVPPIPQSAPAPQVNPDFFTGNPVRNASDAKSDAAFGGNVNGYSESVRVNPAPSTVHSQPNPVSVNDPKPQKGVNGNFMTKDQFDLIKKIAGNSDPYGNR